MTEARLQELYNLMHRARMDLDNARFHLAMHPGDVEAIKAHAEAIQRNSDRFHAWREADREMRTERMARV